MTCCVDKIRKYRSDYNKTLLTLYHLFLLLLVRLGGYIVNLSDFYSYRLIGKLTDFFQLQEFTFRNMIVTSSTSAARRSLRTRSTLLQVGLTWFWGAQRVLSVGHTCIPPWCLRPGLFWPVWRVVITSILRSTSIVSVSRVTIKLDRLIVLSESSL
jgi:hypothetical protein